MQAVPIVWLGYEQAGELASVRPDRALHEPDPRPSLSPMPRVTVDLEKVRVDLNHLDRALLLVLAGRALDLVPRSKLPELVHGLVRLEPVAPKRVTTVAVLAEVKRFHEASLAGDHYETFAVNSKNYMEKSPGTRRFLAEFQRLGRACIKQESKTPPAETREALELLFDLLFKIEQDALIVFFGDEPGSFQVDADYDGLMPVYFRALSKTAKPSEYALIVRTIIGKLGLDYNRREHVEAAKLAATLEQRKALGAGRAPRKVGAGEGEGEGSSVEGPGR
jgi:hypothetical protein